ncbi:GntR family transcriptional regulator [Xinfangfangia sp. CPCC 101601]|uniref:GntR family transcriptional regulator n=1 Tax=Pseudogemmobacter lacusdianii TaxID=3069608 RepID=A0ABU0VWJ4_9RHOB|nr:GntR family transcriptional regulator [Xinfangfangia sp. CPCC 101601]MDQ2066129.1 GntR family transcriptional regulator [Xinfangfangia sp. CPCC 101601]
MSQIASSLAPEIARLIRQGLLTEADLSERALAARFHVSRSPVRVALRELREAGLLEGAAQTAPEGPDLSAETPPAPEADEETYLAIARDRLAGEIPDRISENELIRRYGSTRPRMQALLRRMAEEGWAERLPGHGWRFLPVLTSMQTYRQSYSFRQAIEPAALRDPGFQPDVPELTRQLEIQRRLVAGEVLTISAVQLFHINSNFHDALMACSRNSFFIDALRRVNRLRRLIEYRLTVDREKARARCAEHVRILELVLAGSREEAALLMERHLAALGPIKAPDQAS